MADSKLAINRPSSASTPPNCAICLGSCNNKCFSDSCMHQFCFQCLLEWSKIKAECPLCKQAFKSIIHNVKSNEEYDEHVVEAPRNEDLRLFTNEEFLFLPLSLTPQRHDTTFHVRTTFTVDSRGEHAIQQMLLSHPLTSGRLTVDTGFQRSRILHPRISFRRSIYEQNLWVNGVPDIATPYRECSPTFFRNNPAARQRLVPWLNRELNALLYENTQLIMHVVDLILDHLLRYHICSRTFRNLLRDYLDTKTDHFIHEFYNFMRSPYDMFGYDRSIIYTSRPTSPTPVLEEDTVEVFDDNSNDSDVVFVGESAHRVPAEPVTINLVDTDSDEPMMISSCNEIPMPILSPSRRSPSPEVSQLSPQPSVCLPPKLRYKHEAILEKDKRRWLKKRHRRRSSSISFSSSSSDTSCERDKESYKRYKKRKMKSKHKKRCLSQNAFDSDTEVNITTSDSEDDDNKPLMDIVKRKLKKKKSKKSSKKEKRKKSKSEEGYRSREQPKNEASTQIQPMDLSFESVSNSRYKAKPMDLSTETPSCSRHSGSSTISSNGTPESTKSKKTFQSAVQKLKSEPSTSRYHVEIPKSTRSKVELTDNGAYTSVKIETSRDPTDCTDDLASSRTKIKIVRNGRNSPKNARCKSEVQESDSSTDDYTKPAVKSEIREVKHENPGPSTSKSLPLVFRREHNKWYVFGESDPSSD
ncbi:E3 ubiquitin-protein ligase Topors-like [Sitophilus oryzae]|uniref:E3 ubiquitin-protein ligase Topors n=1 Tax=Sitophilus oryzae TaxID=7048 RepID=A0A6J2YAW9_SITOR|nr:E3 ubiquitin-protein ligase Topors-like [Sitophilus oryzae]